MVTQKRQRQRGSRQARLEALKAARRRKAQRRRLIAALLSSAMLVLGVSVFVGGSGDEQAAETTDTTAAPRRTPVSLSPVAPGTSIEGDTTCPKADGTSERATKFAKAPPMCIDPNKSYSAEVRTSKGTFVMSLDPKAAPVTVNNFVVLARYRYFEGIAFHRIIPGFVVQVGDPTASGAGDPGYKFKDELPQAPYKVGSVAMANNSVPNTNGSQFFIITGTAGVNLPPQYSMFGTITEGMGVVQAIEAVGTPPTPTDPGGQPTEVVTIASVNIRES